MSDRDRVLLRTEWRPGPLSTPCRIWLGGHVAGYGCIKLRGKAHRVHRVIFGPTPTGLDVLHHCDIRDCVADDHLYAGTNDDNIADKVRRGRQARGARYRHAKLSDEAVRVLRDDPRSSRVLAKELGMAHGWIAAIRRREGWRHV